MPAYYARLLERACNCAMCSHIANMTIPTGGLLPLIFKTCVKLRSKARSLSIVGLSISTRVIKYALRIPQVDGGTMPLALTICCQYVHASRAVVPHRKPLSFSTLHAKNGWTSDIAQGLTDACGTGGVRARDDCLLWQGAAKLSCRRAWMGPGPLAGGGSSLAGNACDAVRLHARVTGVLATSECCGNSTKVLACRLRVTNELEIGNGAALAVTRLCLKR